MSFVLRTQADPASISKSLHALLSAADPEMGISSSRTMEQIFDETVSAQRFQMYLAVAFATAALALASLGIYGVIAFTVARRTPEMGIRMALGATGMELMEMVIKQGMLPVIFGLAAGLLATVAISRLMASQLYGVAPNDPLLIASAAIFLLLVALCACWIPARRATQHRSIKGAAVRLTSNPAAYQSPSDAQKDRQPGPAASHVDSPPAKLS